MLILHLCAPSLQLPNLSHSSLSRQFNHYPPFPAAVFSAQAHLQPKPSLYMAKSSGNERIKSTDLLTQIEEENDDTGFEEDDDEFSPRGRFRRSEKEQDYDRNPEFAEIIGSCLDDPQKARSKMEERLRKKRNKILHTKTGSATPMKVILNKFDFSNS